MVSGKQGTIEILGFCSLITLLIFVGALTWHPWGSIILPIPLIVIGWILRKRWIPVMSGQTRIQLASFTLLGSAGLLYFFPNTLPDQVIAFIFQIFNIPQPQNVLWYSLFAQLIISLTIIALNLIWRPRYVTPISENQGDLSVDTEFTKSLTRYCNALVAELERYDNEVNWSDRELIPLEAEVEAESNGRLRPKIVKNLVSA